MKKLIVGLSLIISSVAFAEKASLVYPQVYNFGSSVQVNVWNTTNQNVWCSGTVNMTTDKGQMESQYYNEFVSANFNSYRMIYPRQFGVRIVSVFHSIYCN